MTPSQRIDQMIANLADWRGPTFAAVRKTILAADGEIVEEWKWMGSPVWSRDGIIAVANAHKGKVKLAFMYGAKLPDPDKLFNAGLEGNARRAIDYLEGDKVNARAQDSHSGGDRVQSEPVEDEGCEEEGAREDKSAGGEAGEGPEKQGLKLHHIQRHHRA